MKGILQKKKHIIKNMLVFAAALICILSAIPASAAQPTGIAFTYAKQSIIAKKTLSYTLTPSNATTTIKWKSSDKSIVTVNSKGEVTPVAIGKATITATTSNGKTASTLVYVKKLYPSKISLNKSSATIPTGRAVTLKVNYTPAKGYIRNSTITWKSSNPKVATVNSSGKVKALKTGTTTITATTANGKTSTCKVTVKATLLTTRYGANGFKGYYYVNGRRYSLYGDYGLGTWYTQKGCILTATAIAASGFGSAYDHDPVAIHSSGVNTSYSELRAASQVGSTGLYNAASISLDTAGRILYNMGIWNKVVRSYNPASAVSQITKWAKAGKPVIMVSNSSCGCGHRLHYAFHAAVLVDVDSNGVGTWIDPAHGLLNYANNSGTYFSMTISHFVYNHMAPSSSTVTTAYTTSSYNAGGYILIGKVS